MDALETVVHRVAETNPASAAHGIETLRPDEGARVLERLPDKVAAAVLGKMAPVRAALVIDRLRSDRAPTLVGHLSPREAANVLQHLEAHTREGALEAFPKEQAEHLRKLLKYPRNSAGAIMDPLVASLPVDVTTDQAIAALRETPKEILHYLYVTDRESRLVGVISMRDLLLAPAHTAVAERMRRDVVSVPATMSRDEIRGLMKQRPFLALPVVDDERRLIGVIKQAEILETAREEAFGDLQKLVGAGREEHALSTVGTAFLKRWPWLTLKLLTALAAALVVGLFQEVIARVTALAVLMPLVVAMASNTGSQTLTIVMRGLALREIGKGQGRRVVIKEVLSSAMNGLVVALLAGGIALVWMRSPALAGILSVSIVVGMAAGGFFGALIPMGLRAIGQDPAQSSVILLTTVTDVIAFALFLGLATMALRFLV